MSYLTEVVGRQAVHIESLEAEKSRLEAEITELKLRALDPEMPLPAAKKSSKPRRRMSLAGRVAQSKSWTHARRDAQSQRMSDYWLEIKTRPDVRPNGGI
jgi:hypothetical protein